MRVNEAKRRGKRRRYDWKRLDLLGNPYQRRQACKAAMDLELCYGYCEKCMADLFARVQEYGNEKRHIFRGSKKWDMKALFRECTRKED